MATTSLKPSLNLKTKISNINSGFKKATRDVGRSTQILFKKTRVRNESIRSSKIFSQKREEGFVRKQKESELEASKVGNGVRSVGRPLIDTGKDLLGRIMDAVGSFVVGWLVYNLPTIMTMARDLIYRLQKAGQIIGGFFGNVLNIITGSGKIAGAVLTNITTLDIFDTHNRVKTAFSDLYNTFDAMKVEIQDGIDLVSKPLGELSGEEPVPETGTDYTTPAGQPTTKISGIHRQALDIIAGPESGGSYNAMNQGTVGPNKEIVGSVSNSKTKIGKELTSMTIGEILQRQAYLMDKRNPQISDYGIFAAGKYQIIPGTFKKAMVDAGLKPTDMFSPINQDKMGLAVLRSQGIGAWTAGGSTYNQQQRAIIEQAKRTPVQYNQTSISPAVTAAVTTSVQDLFKGKPGGPAGQITGVFDEQRPGHRHKGIDIAPAGPGYYVSFKKSGTVTYAQFNNGGYGNLVIIKDGNTEYYFAHLAKIMVRTGQSYKGQTIGEIGSTGGSTGIHLHFEVRPNGNPIDPRPYIGLLAIGKQLNGLPGQPTTITTGSLVQQPENTAVISSQQNVPVSLPAQRRSPQVAVIDDRPQQVQTPNIPSSNSQPQMIIISPDRETMLNNLIKNHILLDLAYT